MTNVITEEGALRLLGEGKSYLIRERKFRSMLNDITCLKVAEKHYLIRWDRSGYEEWKTKKHFHETYLIEEEL